MGYIRVGIGKNGQGIGVPISLEIQTSREGLRYNASTSFPTPGIVDSKKVLFITGGVHTDLQKEKPTANCLEQIDEVAVPNRLELEIVVVNDSVDDEGFNPINTPGFETSSSIPL